MVILLWLYLLIRLNIVDIKGLSAKRATTVWIKKKFSHTRKNETERIFQVFEDLRAIKRTRQFAKEEEKKKDEVKKISQIEMGKS